MKRSLLITVLTLLLGTTAVHAETIHLSVAASMTDAFKEIVTTFTSINPQLKVQTNFASSGSLAKQINQGAPADIYVSANPKWMKFLLENKEIAPGTDHIFAYNKLVFTGLPTTKVTDLKQIVSLKRIALGSPKSVPAGQYAKQAMTAAGIYTQLAESKKLMMAKDVRQALMYADRGEVDGSFVYKTDALLARNAIILFTVPDDLYNRVSYPLALTVAGAQKPAAQVFYEFMNTSKVIDILSKYGFEPAQ